MSFKPANEDHAVVDCKFALGFERPFSPAEIEALIQARRDWVYELPAIALDDFDPSDGIVKIRMGAVGKSISFANMRPDGSSVWLMRCAANEIVITCSNYTRWAPTWRIAYSLFDRVLRAMNSIETAGQQSSSRRLQAVALHVTDAFVSTEANPLLELALAKGNRIPEAVYGMGPIWHCHTGWFENGTASSCLNRLNVQVGHVTDLGLQLTVVHEQNLNLEETKLIDFSDAGLFFAGLEATMSHLHQRNKVVLGELLTKSLRDDINLGVG